MLKELNPGVAAGAKAAGVDRYGRMAKRNKNFETVLSGIAVNNYLQIQRPIWKDGKKKQEL